LPGNTPPEHLALFRNRLFGRDFDLFTQTQKAPKNWTQLFGQPSRPLSVPPVVEKTLGATSKYGDLPKRRLRVSFAPERSASSSYPLVQQFPHHPQRNSSMTPPCFSPTLCQQTCWYITAPDGMIVMKKNLVDYCPVLAGRTWDEFFRIPKPRVGCSSHPRGITF